MKPGWRLTPRGERLVMVLAGLTVLALVGLAGGIEAGLVFP